MKCAVFIYIFSFIPVALFAQISGASSARVITAKSVRSHKAKLAGRINIDGNYQTGNVEKTNVSGTVFLSALDSVKEFSANGRFLYGQNNKKVNQREYMAGVQYDYHPFSLFSPFARFEYYQNEFKKINGRYSALAGAKYRYYVKPGKSDCSISAAVLYDLDIFTDDAGLPNKERLRMSVRPKFKYDLTESVYVVTEIFYKPNLTDFCDYIVCGNFNINIRLFKKGLLRFSYEYEYNNRPATRTVKKTDALLLAGLGIEL
jgi:hypothetical protein